MNQPTTRTHIVIPKQIIQAIDSFVGSRQRSKFFVDAAVEKLKTIKGNHRSGKKTLGSIAKLQFKGEDKNLSRNIDHYLYGAPKQ